jgi:NADH:ubiquinone oxidoreductase subunit 3 (subunit A)
MQLSYPFTLDVTQLGLVAFVLAMTFLSGVLGGYLFGLTHTVRQGDGSQSSKSIWTYEDED